LRDRIRATLIAVITLAGAFAAPLAVRAATPPKVVIIVGPTGSVTSSYRSQGDQIAATAAAAGATVVKVYSPNATWANVKAAVNGANIVIYLGHGNGYPNPYTTTFYGDRTDGWGLNRTAGNGDGDNWSTTMVYCGEKALTGTLTSTDGSAQRTYCAGGPITPAAGWVMIYANACYAPGASEPGTTPATATQALQRASYYSRKVLATLRASGYFATDHGASPLVQDLLTDAGATYGAIYAAHVPTGVTVTDNAHLFNSGQRVKLGKRASDPYYTYAFAGDPSRTFGAVATATGPHVTAFSPAYGAANVRMSTLVRVSFSTTVSGVTSSNLVLWDTTYWTVVPAKVAYDSGTHVATVTPALPLQPSRKFAVRVSTHIQDVDGNALVYASSVFTTAKSETYSPQRRLVFAAGTYTGYKFSSTGAVLAARTGTLASASGAPTSTRSGITGKTGGWYLVTAGMWSGYWIREAGGIALQ
jgi:hypothetical protein